METDDRAVGEFPPALAFVSSIRILNILNSGILKMLNYVRRGLVTIDFILHKALSARGPLDALMDESRRRVRHGFKILVGVARVRLTFLFISYFILLFRRLLIDYLQFVKRIHQFQQGITLAHTLNSSSDWEALMMNPSNGGEILRRIGLNYEECKVYVHGVQRALARSFLTP